MEFPGMVDLVKEGIEAVFGEQQQPEQVATDLDQYEPVVSEAGDSVATSDPFSVAPMLDYQQGDNAYGYEGDCGLVSVSNVLQLSGIDASEDDVVQVAVENGLCNSDPSLPPSALGGVSDENVIALLDHYGVDAQVYYPGEAGGTYEDIAAALENGQCVTMGVNAGYLWDEPNYVDSGNANHQIVLTSAARDAGTGEVTGFYICDSGRWQDGDNCRFVSVEEFDACYASAGAASVIITDEATRVV